MAFTLLIKSKGLFNKAKSINFEELISNCGLKYGSDNEFYILVENQKINETAILYNPKRIGRGIFFDSSNVSKGEITISYNIPTTPAEIRDFVGVAKEIERQFGKASFFCEEENREYTISSLENNIDAMIAFSLEKLNEFCSNHELQQLLLTMTMFPWYVDNNKREEYKTCNNLDDFENKLHELQSEDRYYAKPSLFRNKNDGKNLAVYTLTDDCESIFPVKAETFVNMDNIKIDEGLVGFFIFEEKKSVDGLFPYNEFIEFVKEKGATPFDAEHLKVPAISKEAIYAFVDSVNNKIC